MLKRSHRCQSLYMYISPNAVDVPDWCHWPAKGNNNIGFLIITIFRRTKRSCHSNILTVVPVIHPELLIQQYSICRVWPDKLNPRALCVLAQLSNLCDFQHATSNSCIVLGYRRGKRVLTQPILECYKQPAPVATKAADPLSDVYWWWPYPLTWILVRAAITDYIIRYAPLQSVTNAAIQCAYLRLIKRYSYLSIYVCVYTRLLCVCP